MSHRVSWGFFLLSIFFWAGIDRRNYAQEVEVLSWCQFLFLDNNITLTPIERYKLVVFLQPNAMVVRVNHIMRLKRMVRAICGADRKAPSAPHWVSRKTQKVTGFLEWRRYIFLYVWSICQQISEKCYLQYIYLPKWTLQCTNVGTNNLENSKN